MTRSDGAHVQTSGLERQRRALGLFRDCARCTGLCCVALTFRAADGFASDKRADVACHNLLADNGCRVHADLPTLGYHGCIAYDCFGAGQRISQDNDGRRSPQQAQALPALAELHEWLWYLTEVVDRAPQGAVLRRAVDLMRDAVALTRLPVEELSWGDVHRLGESVLPVLDDWSRLVRTTPSGSEPTSSDATESEPAGPGDSDSRESVPEESGPDLSGSDLRNADLRGVDLRRATLDGADLTGADLTGADLRRASLRGARLRRTDLTGADLRRTDQLWADHQQAVLSGTVLTGALFLTHRQLSVSCGEPVLDDALRTDRG